VLVIPDPPLALTPAAGRRPVSRAETSSRFVFFVIFVIFVLAVGS
jgi:hypothetical protein